MLKLMELEYKKNGFNKYVYWSIGLGLTCLIMIVAIAKLATSEGPEPMMGLTMLIELVTSMFFTIFASVMLANFIVQSYKKKTMNVMFSYPISRRQIMISQILAVLSFCFVSLVLTKLITYIIVYFLAQNGFLTMVLDYSITDFMLYLSILFKSVLQICFALIPLFVGLKFKSVPTTIVTSFIVITLIEGNIGEFTLSSIAFVPVIVALVAVVFTTLSVVTIEKRDLI